MSDCDSAVLLAQHQAGDKDAATALFDRYAERLRVLVGRRLSTGIRRRFDSDDVIQSTFRSFFRQADTASYRLERSGDLWRLLAAIALNKLRGSANAHRASKRDVRKDLHFDAKVDGTRASSLLTTDEPRPDEVIAASEIVLRTMRSLDGVPLLVFAKAFQSCSNKLIAESLGVSERTVRRVIQGVRQKLVDELLDDSPSKASAISVAVKPDDRAAAYLRFSDYTLLNMVGRGGMGKVYRARVKKTGAIVAVKTLLKQRQEDPVSLGRFVHEGQLLLRLKHPGIVGLHGIGRYPHGGIFLVLDFVNGEDLAARLKRGPLPQDDAVRVVSAVAEAVQHAHDRGVLHLDLKPANVLLARDGNVFVTDFGFGELLQWSKINAVSFDGGTQAYMAPEQLDRSLGPVGPATDVFGVGGILRAAISESPQRLAPRVHETPVNPNGSTMVSGIKSRAVDRRLLQISNTCLSTSPRDRFTSPIEVVRALQSQLS